MIGFDDRVEARLKKNRIMAGAEKVAPLFQDISTMQAFNITPAEWSRTSRDLKKALTYFRLVEEFHQDIANTKAKLEAQASTPRPQTPKRWR